MTRPHYLRPLERATPAVRHWTAVAAATEAVMEGATTVHRLGRLWSVRGRRSRGGVVTHAEPVSHASAADWWAQEWEAAPRNATPWVVCHHGRWLMHFLDLESQIRGAGAEVTTCWDGGGPLFVRVTLPSEGARPKRLRLVCHSNLWRGLTVGDMAAGLDIPSGGDRVDAARRAAEVLSRMTEGWTSALQDGDFGALQPTVARQAVAALKRHSPPRELLVHGDPAAQRLEREAYVGGRVEARPGLTAEAWEADIPSCYPTIMTAEAMPGRLAEVWPAPLGSTTVGDLAGALEAHLVVAEVVCEQDRPAIPRRLEAGGADHPVGEPFRSVLPTPWLRWALDRGQVRRVGAMALYEPTRALAAVMERLIAARRGREAAGDHAGALTLKICANALHGKLGQHRRAWETVAGVDPPDEYWLGWVGPAPDDPDGPVWEWRWRDGAAQRLVREEGAEAMTAVAAHVSAHARLRLWELLDAADGPDGGGWLYADTDGLWVTAAGLRRLTEAGRAEALRITGPSELEVIAPKQYRVGGRLTAAGLPAAARQQSPEQWEVDRWPSWELGAGDEPGAVRVHHQTWTIRGASP